MICPEASCDKTGKSALVVLSRFETDRKSLDRCIGDLGHQRNDAAGVDPPAEERTERDVAHEMRRDSFAQELTEPSVKISTCWDAVRRNVRYVPVPLKLE